MANSQLAIVEELVRRVKAGDEAAGALLDKGVAYKTLGLELNGLAQVLAHLTGTDSGQVYRIAKWSHARSHGDVALIEAKLPDKSPFNSRILQFHVRDRKVTMIEEQLLLPLKSPSETPLKLSIELQDMINTALVDGRPLLVAHVDEDGQPVLSFRGSIHVVSDDQLAMWVRNAAGRFMRAIARNPKIALMYRDNSARATFQFAGRARVAQSEAEREKVFQSIAEVERDHDFAKLGAAVIIDLDRIEGYAGVAEGGVLGAVNMRRA